MNARGNTGAASGPFIVAAVMTICAPAAPADDAIIIDHTCTDINAVPEYWVEQAKDMFFGSYGHTSHGSQLVSGMNNLNDVMGCSCSGCSDPDCADCLYAWCDDYSFYKYGSGVPAPAGVWSLWDYEPEGASDLGNPNRTAWEAATRTMLDTPAYESRNFVMWSWCGQADTSEENIQLYLNLMSGLELDYPDVVFVYMTGHLNGTGLDGNLHARNEQIRAHCVANGCVLFDFADIESYDPDGKWVLPLDADDGCYYWEDGSHKNWADEWCADHPGDPLCDSCSCAHSRALNCNLKGRAVWWMLARIAGWNGPSQDGCAGDLNCDGIVDFDDIDPFVSALGCDDGDPNCWSGPCAWLNGDCNDDDDVTFDDIDPFVARIGAMCP